MSIAFPRPTANPVTFSVQRHVLSVLAFAVVAIVACTSLSHASSDPLCRYNGALSSRSADCQRLSQNHLASLASAAVRDPSSQPAPTPKPTPSPKPAPTPEPNPSPTPNPTPTSSGTELDQTITVTFNTFVSFPNLAQPIRRFQATAAPQSAAANASYGIGVGVATNGTQTAIAIGGTVSGAAIVSGLSGTSSAALGQGIGIAIVVNTPTSVTNASGLTVITQVISISVNTKLAVFGVGSPVGVGVIGALPATGVRTTNQVSVASVATLSSTGGTGVLVTSAGLTGSTTVASTAKVGGGALATATSANANGASALLVTASNPATNPVVASQGPITVKQTVTVTSNVVIGGNAPGGAGPNLNGPQVGLNGGIGGIQNTMTQNTVTGAGLAAQPGAGDGQAVAHGSGFAIAGASGPQGSSAAAGGQGVSLAATSQPSTLGAGSTGQNVQAVTVTMDAGLSAGIDLRTQPKATTTTGSSPNSGSAGTASAVAAGNGSVSVSTLNSSGAGAAGSSVTATSPQAATAGGGSTSSASASEKGRNTVPAVVSKSSVTHDASTSTGVRTLGATQATAHALASGRGHAATQSGFSRWGNQVSVGSVGRSSTGVAIK